jgi:Na+-transporting NADH:ubiquinone oxidoreductase subunit C
MVLVVATVLSFAAIQLKPLQKKNVEIAKKLDILHSVYKGQKAEEAKDKNEYVEAQYEKYITKSYVVNEQGEVVEGVDAFNVDLKVELAKKEKEKHLPVYEYSGDANEHKYIIPVRGKGLWGPIWGYVALNQDMNTIFGVTFDHQGETPGLGAEIATGKFQIQFKGKRLFQEDEFVSVTVLKSGATPDDIHAVDGVSGGTITSKGLEAMLKDVLGLYEPFFKSKR